jgi:hypothetical protein
MIRKLMLSLFCLTLFCTGCISPGSTPHDPQTPPTPQEQSEIITKRVKYVAIFALSTGTASPYREEICTEVDKLTILLNNYSDRNATFETVRTYVFNQIDSQIKNAVVRGAVGLVVDIALTEAFNYAWEHYAVIIEQDKAAMAISVAKSVAAGIQQACLATDLFNESKTPDNIFTVPHK